MQLALDAVGLVPALGEPADGLNALVSLARGDFVGAGLSAAGMIPFAGWGSAAAKWMRRIDDVPTTSLVDGQFLRALARTADDAQEALFFRQMGQVADDAAAQGLASARQVDDVFRRASQASPDWLRDVLQRERVATAYRKDIARGLVPTGFDPRTAGTGGIREVHAGFSRRHELVTTINGEIRGAIARRGFERSLPDARDVPILDGLAYDRAHLWGPQLGDEAAAGIMYAPATLNRGRQRVLEGTMRHVRATAAEGERMVLQARATSFPLPRDRPGVATLRRAEYDFGIVAMKGGRPVVVERVGVVFDVMPPSVDPRWSYRVVPGGLVW